MSVTAGDEFFEATVDTDEGKVTVELWVITTVRDGRAHALRKVDGWTWVKRSTKNGDFGWAAKISDYNRAAFSVAKGPPADWARTKAAAYTKALPEVEAAIKKLTKIRSQMLGQRTKARSRKS